MTNAQKLNALNIAVTEAINARSKWLDDKMIEHSALQVGALKLFGMRNA